MGMQARLRVQVRARLPGAISACDAHHDSRGSYAEQSTSQRCINAGPTPTCAQCIPWARHSYVGR